MLRELASDRVIDAAYTWLCHQRRHWPANADIWDFRFRWETEKNTIQTSLGRGEYRFQPMSRVTKANGETIHVWSSRDALVLKTLAIVLPNHIPVSRRCTHVKGHGGAKAAVRAVRDALEDNRFVMRTDVKGYYENIDQHRMLAQLAAYIRDRSVLNLVWQLMRRTVTWDGLYRECKWSISRGCPLSPLLGAFFLHELDEAMEKTGLFYVRFMDDILVLSPTRWKLRRAVRIVNGRLTDTGLEKHPDKTFIGRIEKGFDFLGYYFSRGNLRLAAKTVRNFVARFHRLYEQQRTVREGTVRLGDYVARWLHWTRAGLSELAFSGEHAVLTMVEAETHKPYR